MEIIKKIISVQDEKNVRELATSALMQEIWLNLYKHVNIKNEDNYSYASASSQARLQLMMQYIQQNYHVYFIKIIILRLCNVEQKYSPNYFGNDIYIRRR